MKTVTDLMSSPPHVVYPDTELAECAARMEAADIRHLPVVDEDGGLLGMVTDTMLLAVGKLGLDRRWRPDDPADARTAKDLALAVNVTVAPNDAIMAALRRLGAADQDFAVVVNDNHQVIGILTEQDAVVAAAELVPDELTVEHEGARAVFAVGPDATVTDGLARMHAEGVRHLVVVDQDWVAGVVSWRDLASARTTEAVPATVREHMHDDVYTAPMRWSLRRSAERMRNARIGCLPVLDDHSKLIGIVTRRDIIDALVITLETEALFDYTPAGDGGPDIRLPAKGTGYARYTLVDPDQPGIRVGLTED